MSHNYKVIFSHLLRRAGESADGHREENVSMTHGTLGNAHDAVKELIDMIRRLPEDVDLEPWVVSKITIAEDYFDTVRDYLKQLLEGGEPKTAGYREVKPIDPNKYPDRSREGLEGPFSLESGLIVYYSPKEGQYYNPDTDIFLSHDEYFAHNKQAKLRKVDSFTACDHFLPALINDDYSGLEADEERSLRRFEKSLITQHGGPLTYDVKDKKPRLDHCDVIGKPGNVVTVKVYADVSGSKKTSSRKKIAYMEKLEIGSTPHAEDCEQHGPNYDARKARIEVIAFRNQLIRMFGHPPDGASFFLSRNPHEFGTYIELGVKYNTDDEEAEDYAFKLESGGPEHWDAEAKSELAREMAKLD